MNSPQKIFDGRALYADGTTLWCSRGNIFFGINDAGERITRKYSVGGVMERLLSHSKLIRQGLRLGIHHLIPLKNGTFLVSLKKRILILSASGECLHEFSGYQGNKPAHRGICVTPDGAIFLGEYTINLNHRNETRLFRSSDGGKRFECILAFPRTIRHIHFIQYDVYDHCLWLGTGDLDEECKLMRSDDNGDTWQQIGGGNQNWRTVGIVPNPEALYWGTDAGSVAEPNYLIRMPRSSGKLEILSELEGPCHGNSKLKDESVVFSSGVEGGENEKDNRAHLKIFNQRKITELTSMEKNHWPLKVQFGVMRFPMGLETQNDVIFTSYALKNGMESVFRISMEGGIA